MSLGIRGKPNYDWYSFRGQVTDALVQPQAQAVISFLDAVSQRPESTVRESAQRWKTDFENGVKPSFGGMAIVGTGASPSRKRPEPSK